MPIKAAILLCGPSFLIAPGLKVGFAALRQEISPGRFKRHASGLKAGAGAIALLARLAARIEAAMPLPRLRSARDAGSFGNQANTDTGIVDVPGHWPIVDALAGEGGHAPLKRTWAAGAN